MRKGMVQLIPRPPQTAALLASELGFALLQEGAGAFLHVFGGADEAEQVRFDLQALIEVGAQATHDSFLGYPEREGRVADHLLRQLPGTFQRVSCDAVDEAQLQRLEI